MQGQNLCYLLKWLLICIGALKSNNLKINNYCNEAEEGSHHTYGRYMKEVFLVMIDQYYTCTTCVPGPFFNTGEIHLYIITSYMHVSLATIM